MRYRHLSIILAICSIIYASQPKFISGNSHTEYNPVEVLNPKISQTFYGELNREPHFYRIHSYERFNLDISLLVPDIKGAEKHFDIDIFHKDTVIHLYAESASYERIYKPFTGDYYLKGLKYEDQEAIGTYLIKISNWECLGKYALVIGYIEPSPTNKVFSTVTHLPKIKTFLGKSPFTAFFNNVGLFLLASLLILILLIYFVAYIIKKIFGPGTRIIKI